MAIPWYKSPRLIGLLRLLRIRRKLRSDNLHDTYAAPSTGSAPVKPFDPQFRRLRTVDGSYNDLQNPSMGMAGTRFGRNVPLEYTHPEEGEALLTPNPRAVSLELMTRDKFKPATTLNLLAAAWIQFQVHDWLSHGKNEKENPFVLPLKDDDPWPERPMRIRRTRRDPTRPPGNKIPTFLNTETHWWDGSQIYGSTEEVQKKVRSGAHGKLAFGNDGLLPVHPETGIDISGVTGNWWVGLSMLHTLFTMEHNAICDRLRAEHPTWSDDELFHRARLINAALMAKIHTLDWTPGIISHPTVQEGMKGNWKGIAFGIGRIPGSRPDHHAAPYSITEDFVAVYRMHPLMPDEFRFHSLANGAMLQERTLPQVSGKNARSVMKEISMVDLFYSFGIANPGAITLHNYPRFLQKLERPDGPTIDLAAVDILRDRERGVPRYNQFRKLIDLPPVRTFEELTDRREWAAEIRRVYNNDIDRVDLMVGMLAEPLIEGFGFSETAFRIFILMASRRLQSDRFYTIVFTPEIYTRTGIDWVENNNMTTVLLRHFPPLKRPLSGVKNPFAPWLR